MPPQSPAAPGIQTGVYPFPEQPTSSGKERFSFDEENGAEIEQGNDHSHIIDEQVAASLGRSDYGGRRSWCNRKRLITCCFLTTVIVGTVVALLVAYSGPDGPKAFFVGTDPPGITEANAWGIATRDGLTLTVVNALDDFWSPIFDESLADWEAGDPSGTYPDVLTLNPTREAHDPECQPTRGRMRVCNGDYGNTDWQGLNVRLISNDKIVHSVAKMNDYHIRNASPQRQRYTMCHELGHGFGLPHTDENYYNIDRGDCMDYTVRPGFNLEPGTFNFGILNKLYGAPTPAPTATPGSTTSSQQEPSTPRPQSPQNNDKEDKEDKDKDKDKEDRNLGEVIDYGEIPDYIKSLYNNAVKELEGTKCYDILEGGGGRRLVQKCEKDLGDGYRVKVDQLPVLEDIFIYGD